MKNFFISYNKADRTWAEWIAWELEEAGYSVTIRAWDFRPGRNFVLDMQKASAECERTIAVLSPEYLAAGFTQPEWAAAFVQDPTGEERKLIPIRVRECKPDGLLTAIVYIDLVGLDNERALHERLFDGLRPSGRPPAKPNPLAVKKPKKFPGAPPSIWNVTDNRNPSFTGRDKELIDLRAKLIAKKTAAVTAAGAGGIGKTQLAMQYAFRYSTNYDLVWWTRAEDLVTLETDFATLAGRLGLDEKRAVDLVHDHLRKTSDWLIVFDNAGAPTDYTQFIPPGNGHVLVTSRNLNWPDSLELEVLARPDAIAFLQNFSGHTDPEAANALCEALGDLPLAIELAAAYVRESAISIAAYRRDFAKFFKNVADQIANTLRPSFERLEKESPKSLELLSIAAFYAPDDIPRSLLESSIPDPLEFNEAVAGLRRYALVDADEETISVHRLIQQAARDRLPDPSKWAEIAVRSVAAAFPYNKHEIATWSPSARLLPHAIEAAGFSRDSGLPSKKQTGCSTKRGCTS